MDEKKPHIMVPTVDMLEPGVLYSITINPDDRHQYFKSGGDRFEKVRTYLINYHLRHLKESSTFTLYPECSNPWKGGHNKPTRFHYHGSITFKSVASWYSHLYNQLIEVSNIAISPIKKEDVVYQKAYAKKNRTIMTSICKELFTKYKIVSSDIKYIKNRVSERLVKKSDLD